jgi:hypothetical protein
MKDKVRVQHSTRVTSCVVGVRERKRAEKELRVFRLVDEILKAVLAEERRVIGHYLRRQGATRLANEIENGAAG